VSTEEYFISREVCNVSFNSKKEGRLPSRAGVATTEGSYPILHRVENAAVASQFSSNSKKKRKNKNRTGVAKTDQYCHVLLLLRWAPGAFQHVFTNLSPVLTPNPA
jgi:hypothetical protein